MRVGTCKGFTLLEMSVLLVVLGVIATISVAGTGNLIRSSRLAGATNTLIADLRQAQALASSERRDHQVRVASGNYFIVRLSPARTALSRVAPTGVTFAADDTVTFFAWGLATPVTITVSDGTNSKVVQVSANGGIRRD